MHDAMKIAITGGAGFIGSALTHAYLEAGHDVLVIDNLHCGSVDNLDPRARFYEIDIRERRLALILQAERPDIVSHHAVHQVYDLVGETALADADVHIRGLLNVLESCAAANVHKLIFASGGNDLYGHTTTGHLPFNEKSPLFPQQPHDISATAGECYVRYYTQHYRLAHSILRYADIYGESTRMPLHHLHHPLSYFIRMLADQRRPIVRTPWNEIRDHLFISDAVSANLRVLTHGNNQTLHISSGHGSSLKELFEMAAFLLDSDLQPVYLSGALEEGQASILENHKARQLLDWQPRVSLLEGIKHSIALLNVPIADEKAKVETSIPASRENILVQV
jgi:UDP-glucose 4-epimerase